MALTAVSTSVCQCERNRHDGADSESLAVTLQQWHRPRCLWRPSSWMRVVARGDSRETKIGADGGT